jgi:hypothetical protein
LRSTIAERNPSRAGLRWRHRRRRGKLRAMTICDLDLVPGRACGECTVCCTVMAIDKPDIQKEAGVTCRHCRKGCAIYETRPSLCRAFHCGWRQLPILDDGWRPDRSGVLVEVEVVDDQTVLSLILVGNPLKTVRQPWFIDFVITGVRGNVSLYLGIPGPRGFQGASLSLNTRQMAEATGVSRTRVKDLLEKELKRLSAHAFEPRLFVNSGRDVGLP